MQYHNLYIKQEYTCSYKGKDPTTFVYTCTFVCERQGIHISRMSTKTMTSGIHA